MSDRLTVGGQAVIEGVMMRGPGVSATAVRTPEGKIEVEKKDSFCAAIIDKIANDSFESVFDQKYDFLDFLF